MRKFLMNIRVAKLKLEKLTGVIAAFHAMLNIFSLSTGPDSAGAAVYKKYICLASVAFVLEGFIREFNALHGKKGPYVFFVEKFC